MQATEDIEIDSAYIEELKGDFRKFLWVTWKFLGLPEPTPVQYDVANWLQHGPRRKVIQGFRGVGKSWITVAYVCWRLLKDPQYKVLVVSAAKGLADNFSTFALQLINGMPELQHLKPHTDQREAKVQFDVGPALPSKDPSVRSAGITGMITGSRADEIIADDIETPTNATTQGMRDKIAEAVKEFDAVLKPGGTVTYLGTPQCEDSLYTKLPDRGYSVRVWPARYPSIPCQLEDARVEDLGTLAPTLAKRLLSGLNRPGDPSDPRRFSDADLLEREASFGRSGFALQFMLDTTLSDANRFPLKLSDLLVMDLDPEVFPEKVVWGRSPQGVWNELPNVGMSGDRYYRPMAAPGHLSKYQGALLTIDPSGRGKDEMGYCVTKILHGQISVHALGGRQGGYSPENLEFLAQLAKAHKVNEVLIESNFGDGMFTELLKPYLQRIYPVTTVDEKRHNAQKEVRIIETLEPVMNQHRLVVSPKVIQEDYESTKAYPGDTASKYSGFYQLTRITKERGSLFKDDRLDALAMGVARWIEHMAKDLDSAVDEANEARVMEDYSRHTNFQVGQDPILIDGFTF